MPEKTLAKSAILMAAIVVATLLCWELSLRNQGIKISYDDKEPLWADKRALVYAPSDKNVVFIGSSRIKYDLDIPTWEDLTGTHAVQLAIEGSCPRPVLEDLANDPHFKGRLIIDVTESLFFSDDSRKPKQNIQYYHDRTPAQRASFELNKLLESKLVFLDKNKLALNAWLDEWRIPSRTGVFVMPIWPRGFEMTQFSRQNTMSDEFVRDTVKQNQVRDIWYFFYEFEKMAPPMPDETRNSMLNSVKEAVGKIKSRGGDVLFVRTPSTNYPGEKEGYPREKYWEQLLSLTQCPGVHYADYPGMNQLVCPELSHLTPKDAAIFTQQFVDILKKEKGWHFPKQ